MNAKASGAASCNQTQNFEDCLSIDGCGFIVSQRLQRSISEAAPA